MAFQAAALPKNALVEIQGLPQGLIEALASSCAGVFFLEVFF